MVQAQENIFPYLSSSLKTIPSSYFLLTHDQRYGYTSYLCLSHQNLHSTLLGNELHLHSGTARESQRTRSVCVCVRGDRLEAVLHRTVKEALFETGNVGKMVKDKLPLPDFLHFMGWKSGVAFGDLVSHSAILDAVESLLEKGVAMGYVLIDEGWQEVQENPHSTPQAPSLFSFEADRERFPGGLLSLSHDLRHLNIPHVGICHALMGHQGGVHPALATQYELPQDQKGRFYPGNQVGNSFQFFYDYYEQLKSEGMSFVKVTHQSTLSSFCPPEESQALYKTLQVAIQAAASIHFNSVQLNSDCLNNEALLYWATSAIASSGPDSSAAGSASRPEKIIPFHLRTSLLLRQTSYPDFGGWSTHCSEAETFAIFHALSGTPHLLSDPPIVDHVVLLLRKAVLPSGRLMLCDSPLTLTNDSLFCDPEHDKQPYKAYTFKSGFGILAAFNFQDQTLNGQTSAKELLPLTESQEPFTLCPLFAVYSYRHGFLGIKSYNEPLPLRLKAHETEILTFAPFDQGVALIGCHSLFLPPGPIVEMHHNEETILISSLLSGHLLLYCERAVLEIRRNDLIIPWEQTKENHLVSIDPKNELKEIPSLFTITFEA
jgi:hypothetical protein